MAIERKPIVIDAPWNEIYSKGYVYDNLEIDQDMVKLISNHGRSVELPYIRYLETSILHDIDRVSGLVSMSENHFNDCTIFNPIGEYVYSKDCVPQYEEIYLKRYDEPDNIDIYKTQMYPDTDDIFCYISTDSIDF